MPNALPLSAGSSATLASLGAVAATTKGRLSTVARNDLQVPVVYLHGEDPTQYIKEALRKGFTFITVAEFADALAGKALLPAKPTILIYDDCHLMQYRLFYPVLQSYGVKATFACVPNFIDGLTINTALATFLTASFTADTTSGSSTLANLSNTTNLVQGTKITGAGIPTGTVLGTVGTTTATMVDANGNPVNATATATAVAITGPATPMTWPQLNEMIAAGHDVQNHTLQHNQTTADTQAARLADYPAASARITAMTGKTPRALMYPQGVFSAAVLADIKSMGFELAFQSQVGVAGVSEPAVIGGSRFAIPRLITPGSTIGVYSDVIYNFEDDVVGVGANAGNALGYWSTAPTYVSNGETIELTGATTFLAPADYFRVRPGSILYWQFNAYTTGQSAGTAALEIQEYTGPASAKVAGTLNTLKSFAATTASTSYEGSIVLGATTTFVRFSMHNLASFNGTLGKNRAVTRVA